MLYLSLASMESSSIVWTAFSVVFQDNRLALLAIVLIALLVWRIIRFTFLPWLFPKDPQEYPYWIPIIGELQRAQDCIRVTSI